MREIPHRTYLWVHLIFDHIQQEDFTHTLKGAESLIRMLPRSINDAYERILSKCKEGQEPVVRKALSIILAARRPLTLLEINVAMSIDDTATEDKTKALEGLDLEDEVDFISRLRSCCGLFISIHQGRVYFLHQTAREFLLGDSTSLALSGRQWHHSITTCQAHHALAKLCIRYLDFLDSEFDLAAEGNVFQPTFFHSPFFDYASNWWDAHFREAHITDDDSIIPAALRICSPKSSSQLGQHEYEIPSHNHSATALMVASFFGVYAIAKLLIDGSASIQAEDQFGQTSVYWAAAGGHEAVVKLLVENGGDIETERNRGSCDPLLIAACYGHTAVVKLLIEKGADIEMDYYAGEAPLSSAARGGHEAAVKLLIEKGADIEAKGYYGQTPLSLAAREGRRAVVQLLIEKGADIEAKDEEGQTPLSMAAREGHETTVSLLIEKGADLEAKDHKGQTPLLLSTENYHETIIKLLIEKGADIEAKDDEGQTLLLLATRMGQEAIVKLAIEMGADIEAMDNRGRTPLAIAVFRSAFLWIYDDIVELLVKNGADIRAKDKNGQTPLSIAEKRRSKTLCQLLLGKEAAISTGACSLMQVLTRQQLLGLMSAL